MDVTVRPPLTTHAPRQSSRMTGAWRAVGTGFLASVPGCAVLAVSAVLMLSAGAYGIPHNDDWAFSRVALDLRESGTFRLNGAGRMTLIGHALWGQPFLAAVGPGLAALHLANLVAAVVGVTAIADVTRRLTGSWRKATLAGACVALLPGYALLSAGFMTDITAFAGQALAVAFGAAALQRNGRSRLLLLAGAAASAVAAVSSRQTAIAALAALGLAAVLQNWTDRSWRRMLKDGAVLGVATASVAALLLWRAGLPDQDVIPIGRPDLTVLIILVTGALGTVALGVAPAALCTAGARSRAVLAAVAAVSLAGGVVLATTTRELFLGNTLTRFGGPYGVITGSKQAIFPGAAWTTLETLAMSSGLLVLAAAVAAAVRLLRTRPAAAPEVVLVAAFLVASTATSLAPGATGSYVFDRYLWGPAAALIVLLLRVAPDHLPRPAIAAVATAMAGVFAVITLTTYESAHASVARWQTGQSAVAEGISAVAVDAGYEWTGWHARLPVPPDRGPAAQASVSWWSRLYAPDVPCVVLTASPLDDRRYRLTARHAYSSMPWMEEHILEYRFVQGCNQP